LVTNGLFGDNSSDFNVNSDSRHKAQVEGGPYDKAASDINFDDEARKILSMNLNLGADGVSNTNRSYNDFDAIYRCPQGGGTIYVGNERAAKNLATLKRLRISRVVNCTQGPSMLPNFHQSSGDLLYLNFTICYWYAHQ
jgi:hypothetical protein